MSPAATAERKQSRDPHASPGGRRLAAAFGRASTLPALSEARQRLLDATSSPASTPSALASLVESDTGLTIAVLRAANNGAGPPGRCHSVLEAIESLSPDGVTDAVVSVDSYDIFDSPNGRAHRTERYRRHAIAVREAAERIAEITGFANDEDLAAAALLHDVGRFVIADLHPGFDAAMGPDVTAEERLVAERRELGIDHAFVGAVLVRRWGLPAPVAATIERHHAPDATGLAAVLRLADLVVHHATGDPVDPRTTLAAASALGISPERLRTLLYEFPGGRARDAGFEPCPLSARELDALRGLSEGKVYKQIAQSLGLSVSTVRTHLHNVYGKIGAVDRAQAVLIARDKGWL